MDKNIGVDPSDLLGLQSELALRLRQAHEQGDAGLPKALAAVLKANPGRRQLLVEGRPFQRQGAILIREPLQLSKDLWLVDKDPRAMQVVHVDWDRICYRSFAEEGEVLDGNEKLTRMKQSGVIRLDWSWGSILMEDHRRCGPDSILEHLYREKEIERIDFFGTITKLRNPGKNDDSYVYILCRYGNETCGHWDFVKEPMTAGRFGGKSMSPIVELTK